VLYRDFYNLLLATYRPEEVKMQLDQVGPGYLFVELVSDCRVLIFGQMAS